MDTKKINETWSQCHYEWRLHSTDLLLPLFCNKVFLESCGIDIRQQHKRYQMNGLLPSSHIVTRSTYIHITNRMAFRPPLWEVVSSQANAYQMVESCSSELFDSISLYIYKVKRGLGKWANTGLTMVIPKGEKEIGIVGRCGILLLSPVGDPLPGPP